MAGFVQRYPFSPRAVWWKRFSELDSVTGNADNVMKFDKNTYRRMFEFDCIKESDQRDGLHQPILGLLTESSYLTIKTQNFAYLNDSPKQDDIILFEGKFWLIAEITYTTIYSPKAIKVLHIALKAIKR